MGFELDVISSGSKQAIKLSKKGSREIIEKEAEIVFKNLQKITGTTAKIVGFIGPSIYLYEILSNPEKFTLGNFARLGIQIIPIVIAPATGPFAPLVGIGFAVVDMNIGEDIVNIIDN